MPVTHTAPAIAGAVAVGSPLTVSTGTWTPGGRAYAYRYQWLRCTNDEACTPIVDATGASYTPTRVDDPGSQLQVEVTASTQLHGMSSTGHAQTPRSASVPLPVSVKNVVPPTIAGTAKEGATLHASLGTWSAAGATVSTRLAWERCGLTDCTPIAGADGADHAVTGDDVGRRLRVQVTGAAGTSSMTVMSGMTAFVSDAVPVNVHPPTLTPAGPPTVGDAITAVDGDWSSPAPTTFTYQWQRCPAGTSACTDIAGATANPYTTVAADADAAVRVRVTLHHRSASAAVTSAPTQTITGLAPVTLTAPDVTGQAVQGATLTASGGTFGGSGLVATTGRWQRCDPSGATCTDVAGQTGTTYVLGAPDLGASLVYVLTGTNAWGTASRSSAATAVVSGADPVNTSLPAITGALYQTGTATASIGTWTGLTPMTFTYAWQRCTAAGTSCTTIAGATGPTYQAIALDVASTLRVTVTATNAVHGAPDRSATSAVSGLVGPSPAPALVTPPTITGTGADGATLTWHAGTYTGQQPITFTRQWQRCTAGGSGCVDIAGATGTTVQLGHGDVGLTFRVHEAATNAFGSTPGADSSITVPVVATAPANTVLPAVSGTAVDGSTLTATAGTWSGTPVISSAYQWRRCDVGGAACVDVGAAADTYALTAADVGSTIRVVVTGSNVAGAGSPATSAATAPVAPLPPAVSTPLPVVTGTAAKLQVLTTTTGTFTGTAPLTYTYQWRRCNTSGGACTSIASATASTYTLGAADVGATVRSRVTAHSSRVATIASEDSAPTPIVADVAVAPTVTAPAAISGAAQEHTTITAVAATVTGTAPVVHAFQWQRCNAAGAACMDVTDTTDPTGATWILGPDDIGTTMRVVDTASNAAGTVTSTSAPTDVVIETFPAHNTVEPAISGSLEDGATLTAVDGTWTGTPTIAFTYAWYRCALDGTGCTSLPGATTSSYRLVTADVGSALQLRVHGVNEFGAETVSSAVSSEVAPARVPVNSGGLPSINPGTASGVPETTRDLTVSDGAWSGSEAVRTYQWERCDAFGEACTPMPGATDTTYHLVHPTDAGVTFRVLVTYTNPAGTDTAESPSTLPVLLATAPTTSGTPVVDLDDAATITLRQPAPVWTGTEAITYEYEWMQCFDEFDPAQCSGHGPRGDSTSYHIMNSDFQDRRSWMRMRMWASNAVAPAGVSSPLSNAFELAVTCVRGTEGCGDSCLCINLDPPTVTGDAIEPGALGSTNGRWIALIAVSYSHQWLRCDGAGAGCLPVPGATAPTIDLTPADIGHRFRIQVIAHNENGSSAPAESDPSPVVTEGQPPVNTAAPVISVADGAVAQVGVQMQTDDGTWTGMPAVLDHAYQWLRCDADGSACTDIVGATSMTYTPTQDDLGLTVQVRVTATNIAGSASEVSAAFPAQPDVVVQADEPVPPPSPETAISITNLTGAPTDPPYEGQRLSVDPGSWGGTQPIEFAFRWQLCDSAGASCTDIVGATEQTHLITHDEVGGTLRVVLVASNASLATQTATSGAYPASPAVVLAAVAPSLDLVAPPVSSSDDPERTVQDLGNPGTWVGTQPMSVSVQWQRCASLAPASCADITGETSSSYTPTSLDVNAPDAPYHLRLVVTATNVAGSVVETSPISPRGVLPGTAPSSATPPVINGPTTTGSTLTADPGTWTGTDYPDAFQYSYQWQRCNSAGADCHDRPGETGATYVLGAADVGQRLVVEVAAHNLVGVSVPVTSAASATIT